MPQMHTFVEHEAAFPGLIPFLLLSWHQSSSLCWGLQAGAAPLGEVSVCPSRAKESTRNVLEPRAASNGLVWLQSPRQGGLSDPSQCHTVTP